MGKTRRKKVPSPLRKVIAGNVIARAAIQFRESPNVAVSIREGSHPAESERMAVSHIRRIMKGGTSVTLEQLDGLARALDLQPYQLLLPNMDPTNPQVARGAVPGEDQVYGIARRAAQEAVQAVLATNGHHKARKRAKAG
jgi:hypothetical protein